jgi:hypothetical protein
VGSATEGDRDCSPRSETDSQCWRQPGAPALTSPGTRRQRSFATKRSRRQSKPTSPSPSPNSPPRLKERRCPSNSPVSAVGTGRQSIAHDCPGRLEGTRTILPGDYTVSLGGAQPSYAAAQFKWESSPSPVKQNCPSSAGIRGYFRRSGAAGMSSVS